MAIGYFIGLGDKTSCGGKVLDADTSMMMFGFARAREGDQVSCGKDGMTYQIIGGVPNMRSNGRLVAGTLDSLTSCPCRAKLITSNTSASYQSSNGSAPTQRAPLPVAAREPVAKKLADAEPANPGRTPAFKSRWGEEPGFYIVPRSTSRETLMAELFGTPNSALIYRFNALNPRLDIFKAGTMVVLSDPANLQCTREEALLMSAAAETNAPLELLTAEEANFMMRHRDEIANFLGYGSTSIGIGEVMFARHLKNLAKLLDELEGLHQRSFQIYGHLRAPEFFSERRRLFIQMNLHFDGITRKGTGFPDHPSLKSALGISSRSLVHHWTQVGEVGPIPGYAEHVSGVAKASKIINMGGWIGTGLGGGASYLKVQEVCAAGESKVCERIKFTESGAFAGGVGGGIAGGMIGARLATPFVGTVCVGLGVATGGVGAIACGLVVVGGSAFVGGVIGEKAGGEMGDLIYRYIP